MERLTPKNWKEIYRGSEELLHPRFIKLAEYEDTGLTPEEISAIVTINGNLVRTNKNLNARLSEGSNAEEHEYCGEYGTDNCQFQHKLESMQKELQAYKDAEEQGLLIKLPCKVGDTVYTIGVDNAPCENCQHGKEVNFDIMECLINHKQYECPAPEHYIEEKICNGFEVTTGGIELVEEWGYDMTHIFEPYYFTREAAEEALKPKPLSRS